MVNERASDDGEAVSTDAHLAVDEPRAAEVEERASPRQTVVVALARLGPRAELELGLTVAAAAMLLSQPGPWLFPGLGLLALAWAPRWAARVPLRASPLDAPLGLYLGSAAVGLALTTDWETATIRWWGLVGIASVCLAWQQRAPDPRAARLAPWLVLSFGLAGAMAVLALSQGRVARGPLGQALAPVLDLFASVPSLTEPVMHTNTRYIVNYNGLADMTLLVATAAVLLGLETRLRLARAGLFSLAGLGTLLAVATGGRGGILGLLAALGVAVALWSPPSEGGRAGGGEARLPRSRKLLVGLSVCAAGLGAGASGLLDKRLELDSVGGRLVFWTDLVAMLGDYAFTGLGLGMQSPLNAFVVYGTTPSPETMVYAHNMFLQAYLEQGPLGAVALALLVAVPAGCALLGLRRPLNPELRTATVLGLAILAGVTLHGLTDQVPTTNFGTLTLLGAGVLATSGYVASARTDAVLRRPLLMAAVSLVASVGLGFALARPGQLADLPASLGALEATRAAGARSNEEQRARASAAEAWLLQALAWSPQHAPAHRHLAWLKTMANDPGGAAQHLAMAIASPRLSGWDAVQVGRLYYRIGFLEDGDRWSRFGVQISGGAHRAAAYAYARLVLDQDWRTRTLVQQALSLRAQRRYADALALVEQALLLAPDNAYLLDQLRELRRGAAEQALAR